MKSSHQFLCIRMEDEVNSRDEVQVLHGTVINFDTNQPMASLDADEAFARSILTWRSTPAGTEALAKFPENFEIAQLLDFAAHPELVESFSEHGILNVTLGEKIKQDDAQKFAEAEGEPYDGLFISSQDGFEMRVNS